MQVFDASQWKVGKGKVTLPTKNVHFVQIQVSCTQDVQLFGLRGEEEVPLKIGREFRTRAKTQGFDKLFLKGKPQCAFGYNVTSIARQDGEPLNSDNPPAIPMPGPGNLLLEMRRLFEAERNRNRPPILDPEDLPWGERYTIDEDDFDFEEDILSKQQQAVQANSEISEVPPSSPLSAAEPPGEADVPPPIGQAAE